MILRLEHNGPAACITLHRPERRNALTLELMDEFASALDTVEAACADGPTRALILTGSGDAFCSGMDIEMLRRLRQQQGDANAQAADSGRFAALLHRLYTFPCPTIAAVNGPAVAGGCGLASACDFTLAVPAAVFGYPEVKIGFLPALVSVYLLRQVGEKRARDLLLTGRSIAAAEALAWGLITEIVPPERLLERAQELASQLAANSPNSLRATKRLLLLLPAATLDSSLALAAQQNAAIRQAPDFIEGVSAFLEKRKPVWRA